MSVSGAIAVAATISAAGFQHYPYRTEEGTRRFMVCTRTMEQQLMNLISKPEDDSDLFGESMAMFHRSLPRYLQYDLEDEASQLKRKYRRRIDD